MNTNTLNELVEFWFSDEVSPYWFNSTDELDALLKNKYEELYQRHNQIQEFSTIDSPVTALALVILFDQIPLNIFRGKAQSFATEAMAREVAENAIAKGFDNALSDQQKMFLYLPYMHSENLADQDKSVELFENAGLSDNAKYARHHRKIVQRFGRFPHRNAILGRQSTSEEENYLASEGAFHG